MTLGLLGLVACSDGDAGGQPGGASGVDSSDQTSARTGDPVSEWTIGLDSRPTRAVTGGDRLYVSTSGGTRFPPQVVAIDPVTGTVVAQRTATGQPYDLLVAPDGRLWIAGDRHPDQPGGAGINVYDPSSLVVVEHANLPSAAYSLAVVSDEIWVGSDDVVLVLDPATLALLRTVSVGGPAYQLLVPPRGDGVLVVGGDRIERLGTDGVPTASQPVAADGNIVVAATAATLWVRSPVGTDSTILTLDPALTAAAIPAGVDTDSAGGGLLATASGDVLLVDDRRDEVRCLPGGSPPAVSLPAVDLVGVLAELPDGRVLFATSSGVAVREIAC